MSMAPLTCVIFVVLSYGPDYSTVRMCWYIDMIMTQLLVLEIFLNWFVQGTYDYFPDPLTYVDIATLLPFFISLVEPSLYEVIFVLVCLENIPPSEDLQNVQGYEEHERREKASGAGVCHNFQCELYGRCYHAADRNTLARQDTNCKYINADTLWRPSCSVDTPLVDLSGSAAACLQM